MPTSDRSPTARCRLRPPLSRQPETLEGLLPGPRAHLGRTLPHHDRDAFKELRLLFDNDRGRFPLYPGDTVWIEYAYTVSDTTSGRWFQQAVRLPTEHP